MGWRWTGGAGHGAARAGRGARAIFTAAVAVLLLAAPARAAHTYTVSTVNGLNTAVGQAHAGDVIILAPATFAITSPIVDTVGINFQGTARKTIIDASGGTGRVFTFGNGSTAIFSSVSDITIEHGDGTGSGGVGGGGVLVRSGANAAIQYSLITHNTVHPANGTDALGGGVLVRAGGQVNLFNDAVLGNTVTATNAQADGGGVTVSGIANILSTTVGGTNTASSDTGASGGGVFLSGGSQTALLGDTLAHNTVVSTGGVSNDFAGGNLWTESGITSVQMQNSIVSDGTAPKAGTDDCAGSTLAEAVPNGYNVIETPRSPTCPGTETGDHTGNPNLGALANNTGPTNTYAIPAGGLADGNAKAYINTNAAFYDQRAVSRSSLPNDIGAFELRPASAALFPSSQGATGFDVTATISPYGESGSYYFEEWSADPTKHAGTTFTFDGTKVVNKTYHFNLPAGSTYHADVVMTTAAGTSTSSAITIAPSTDGPTAIIGTPTHLTATSATLKATVTPGAAAATYHFEYSEADAGGSGAVVDTPDQTLPAGAPATAVSAKITGLSPSTQYQFNVVVHTTVADAGASGVFTTPSLAPVVSNPTVTDVSETTATLHATVVPQDTLANVSYEISTDPSLTGATRQPGALASADDPNSEVTVDVPIASLTPGTTYYFTIIASGDAGENATPVTSFKTLSGKPPPGHHTLRPSLSRVVVKRIRSGHSGTVTLHNSGSAGTFTITFARKRSGHRTHSGRCSRTVKHGRKCTLYTKVKGSVKGKLASGNQKLKIPAKLGGAKLAPGTYRISIASSNGAGKGKARTAKLTVTR